MRLIAVLIFGILAPLLLNGQQVDFSVDHFSVEHGLVDRRVRCILEHSNGFVYVGTANGLSRFDGYSFTDIDIPTVDKDWQGIYVGSLLELSDGRILMIANPSYGFRNDDKSTLIYLVEPQTGIATLHEQYDVAWSNIPMPLIAGRDTLYSLVVPQLFRGPSMTDGEGNTLQINSTSIIDGDTAILVLNDGRLVDLKEPILTTGSYTQVYSKDLSRVLYVTTNKRRFIGRID